MPAAAQPSPSFRGPISGFVYNQSSRTIRPLLGIPGATRIGTALLNEVDFASIGPDGKWAFLTRAGHSTFVYDLSGQALTELSADGLIDAWHRHGTLLPSVEYPSVRR